MTGTALGLATGETIEVTGDVEEVAKQVQDASRSSAGALAWFELKAGGRIAVNPAPRRSDTTPRRVAVRALGQRLIEFCRRRRTPLTIAVSVAVALLLAAVLAGRRARVRRRAVARASLWVLAGTALLQVVALVSRSEAWHLTIGAAGGTVDAARAVPRVEHAGGRRRAQRAPRSRGADRRAAALVRGCLPAGADARRGGVPDPRRRGDARRRCVVHAGRAARLPWWLPLIVLAVVGLVSAGLRQLALRKGRELWRGLAVLRSLRGGSRVVGFVLVAVVAQILRNWMILRAVGVDASVFDATAVLIAVVTLAAARRSGVGAAAAVLILGRDGVPAAAAGGLLLTVTGTLGGLCFAGWAGADHLWSAVRGPRLRRSRAEAQPAASARHP